MSPKCLLLTALALWGSLLRLRAQELNAKVVVNSAQISNTKNEVFTALQEKMQNFLNEHRWTDLTFQEQERIACNLNLTISKWDESTSAIEAVLLLTSSRPVYNSTYTTTLYSVKDPDFNFHFQTTDQLEWNPENVDNNLTALLAYYAYLIIGYDMDSMAPLAGTPYLLRAEDIVTKAQSLGATGWSSFNDSKNRFALLNDYLDGSMEDYRRLIYQYHRQGLDQMAANPEQGRKAITEAIDLLENSRNARVTSHLPVLFTENKRDELVNLYRQQDQGEGRQRVYQVLSDINPSLNDQWEKLLE